MTPPFQVTYLRLCTASWKSVPMKGSKGGSNPSYREQKAYGSALTSSFFHLCDLCLLSSFFFSPDIGYDPALPSRLMTVGIFCDFQWLTHYYV